MSATFEDEVRSRDELVAVVRELRQDYLRRGVCGWIGRRHCQTPAIPSNGPVPLSAEPP